MTRQTCPGEAEVFAAVDSGRLDASLEAHFADCAACRQARRVAQFMKRAAEQCRDEHRPLPDPMLIWLKAELARRNAAGQRRARRQIWRNAAIAFVVLALSWPAIEHAAPYLRQYAGHLPVGAAALVLLGLFFCRVLPRRG